jgi:hypothetical protein
MGLRPENERALARAAVRQLHSLLVIVSIYERLVAEVYHPEDREPFVTYPQAAIFYWSSDQLDHVQELLERHLTYLMTDESVREPFHQLLQLMTPSESDVQRDYQHQKLFDMREFVETSVGLPQIINYTWHEIAEQQLGGDSFQHRFSRRFWPRNFNYMDFSVWHEFLGEMDAELTGEIRRQSARKAEMIGRLMRHFQREGHEHNVLSRSSRPLHAHKIDQRSSVVPDDFHFLARVWSLYAKLNEALQEQDALVTRLTFPARSIGKLAAGHVSSLHSRRRRRHGEVFVFELRGISSNMKIKEGSFVRLVHDDYRDQNRRDDTIIIEEMEWMARRGAYRVTARDYAGRGRKHYYFTEERHFSPDGWYLYPHTSDIWSGRLFGNQNSLLDRRDQGTSWLGDRCAFLLGLAPPDRPLVLPEELSFSLSEIYTYAPSLLPAEAPEAPELRTKAAPKPDRFQAEAIELALASTVTCIQGPPGTGKSQTIAALVDEFIRRRDDDEPLKILVTSFSYAPLYVVVDKLAGHRDERGRPTEAAKIPKYFLRSSGRDPIEVEGVHDVVLSSSSLRIDDRKIKRTGTSDLPRYAGEGRRLEDAIGERFVCFANAHQLYYLGAPSSSKRNAYEWIHDAFAFDLIVVDEASQMPVDHVVAALNLVVDGSATLSFEGDVRPDAELWDRESVASMRVEELVDAEGRELSGERLTKVVVVGDHNQLPPVQPVEPPEKLRPVLGSLFEYYVEHQGVPSTQLARNYRSDPQIVDYTRHLGIYRRDIEAFRTGADAHEELPPPPDDTPDWIAELLADERVVGSLVHERDFETAVSPLEAELVRQIAVAFWRQMAIDGPDRERSFWREDLGIVAPHNAQGRLIIRSIHSALTDGPREHRTHLESSELMALLRETIYTVEKFQGSDRTFIVASMGISSMDQLRAEEAFIYDMNRLNVLTSRAKKKMLLLCSRNYLDYTPKKREVVAASARARDYVQVFCNSREIREVRNEEGSLEKLEYRYHDPDAPVSAVLRPLVDTTRRQRPTSAHVERGPGADELLEEAPGSRPDEGNATEESAAEETAAEETAAEHPGAAIYERFLDGGELDADEQKLLREYMMQRSGD